MGKKKVGKQRKDKYYQLAKETGFRSRAAFKLIQINRQFEFLQKSQVCIDLCAAPGGWMQVAKQNMPVSSIVIGVDLFPIKPIPGCISLVEDITTDKCRVALTKELKTWKADVILHDGAPNVGKNWLHDAYQQNCLTLSALKLGTQFLRQGGWFITKIFRSKDYHALQWVLRQFFKKVHVTKPLASRTESAEIFVICKGYIAPDKIDSKFLDPKYVFQELELEPQNKLNVFHPDKVKNKAEGYPENDYTLYHKVNVSDFINHEDGIELLEHASEIVFDDDKILNHEKTTKEIKECCKDIKVLGRKDIRKLLAWQKVLHEEFTSKKTEEQEGDSKKDDSAENKDGTETDNEEDELKNVDLQILELQDEERREMKRKRKKVLKERKKLNERLNLKMVLKGDGGPTMEAEDLFTLKKISTTDHVQKVLEQQPDVVAESSDSEDEKPKPKYLQYEKETGHLDSSGTYYKDSGSEMGSDNEEDDDEIREGLGMSDEEEEEEENTVEKSTIEEEDTKHPFITDLDHRDKDQKKIHKAELWFARDAFKDLINEKDDDIDLDRTEEIYKKKGVSFADADSKASNKKSKKQKDVKKTAVPTDSDYSSQGESESDTDSDGSDYVVEKHVPVPKNNAKKDGFEIVKNDTAPVGKKRKYKLSPEELALGTMMVNSKKTKRDLIDAAWNRYAVDGDEKLPDWFVQDEQKHMRSEIPVPQDLVGEYKKRLDEINARPIKKVIEAKARKKKRALKKLEKAKKKVEAIMDNVDVTEREKARQVKQLYKKAHQEPKKEITYVVAKKHMAAKKMKRPKGVKGPYKVVDARMKKDLRAQKAKAKTVGRGKKTKKFKSKSKSK